ncbi:MAG: Chemotaxis protein MotB [Hydrocarboniphaga sp.]|uniref:flagellar motor protein MotD n=1 Tax=Hydrocarboniphaga sp. TaxID=2033016 RepID=UPI002603905B|nr:flagellar motor protein MotD [Hydrocarboniphaga sp.]MDB5972111.1 Chemotaxis protein MotB [Hydrocarboniphaga sp.]
MARKKPHEDHVNHEAWAIPYGDMLVLLLALFVVMYAVSSVNEGKYRVLADSLNAEFSGTPRTMSPVQLGTKQTGSEADSRSSMMRQRAAQTAGGPMAKKPDPTETIQARLPMPLRPAAAATPASAARTADDRRALQKMGAEIQDALGDLVKQNLVRIRASELTLEVEIRADILFPSGSSQLADQARPVLGKVADILRRFPNPMRVEGHTDSLPISTPMFPSNWELSSARAASVVHLFVKEGIEPTRLSVAGFGEFRPAGDNTSVDGRNRNRRVIIVVLARAAEGLPPIPPVDAPASPSAAAASLSEVAASKLP